MHRAVPAPLRMPVMAAGLVDRLYDLDWLLDRLEEREKFGG